MRGALRIALVAGLSAAFLLPLSFALTLLLVPFWRWLEATSTVEAIGHSGPSSWCYGSVHGVSTAIAWIALLLVVRRRRQRQA